MFKNFVSIVFISLISFGCQSLTNLQFNKSIEQKEFFLDGGSAIASTGKNSVLLLAASSDGVPNGERISLALRVINQGLDDFVIDTNNISIASNHSSPIQVYSYSQLVKEETEKRNLRLVLNSIAGAANAYSASQAGTSYSSGSFSSNTYNGSGSTYVTNGTYSSRTYNPYQAQIAQQQASAETNRNANSITNASNSNLSHLKSTILKKTTVFPNTSHSGIIVFDAPAVKNDEIRQYQISVSVAGEAHSFLLTQRKTPKN